MNKRNKDPENLPEKHDDFEEINGIGTSIAKALYQKGILHYSELAQFTPEKLANLLSNKVAFVSAQRIENDDWLGQARKLADKQLKPVSSDTQQQNAQASQRPESQEKHSSNSKRAPASDWREMADFFVSFGEIIDPDGKPRLQTKVHHSQGDQSECWDGIVVDKLIQWMLAHANIPQASKSGSDKSDWDEQINVQTTELDEQVELEVSDLWVSQVTLSAQDEPNTTQNMVRVEGVLNFGGPDALSMTYERVPYAIEIYLVNKENNHSNLTATYTCQTDPHKLHYKFQQDFAVPERGKYRICLKARLLHPFMAEVHAQGPILKVGIH